MTKPVANAGTADLLGVGIIGMVHNIFVAGCGRPPSAFGVHVRRVKTISASKVSKTLMMAEQLYEGVGTSLIPVYYPGGFRPPTEEADFWRSKGIISSGENTNRLKVNG